MIVGDLNVSPSRAGALAAALAQGMWYDVAALQHLASSPTPLRTCCAHNSATPTRRDFLLVPARLLPFVVRVEVLNGQGFDVHSPLRMHLRPDPTLQFRRFSPERFQAPPGLSLSLIHI
eukprot:15469707-Alexandrium_andersonii.AAC.1